MHCFSCSVSPTSTTNRFLTIGWFVVQLAPRMLIPASEKVREDHDLPWDKWAKRVNEVLLTIEKLVSPDLFIIGGGVSKKSDKFLPHLDTRAEVVPAQLLN